MVAVAHWTEFGTPLEIPVISIEEKQLQSFSLEYGDVIINMSDKIKEFPVPPPPPQNLGFLEISLSGLNKSGRGFVAQLISIALRILCEDTEDSKFMGAKAISYLWEF